MPRRFTSDASGSLDPMEYWYYNDATYCAEVDGLGVTFAIQPSSRDVRIDIERDGYKLFEFNAIGVSDVRGIDDWGVDAVEVAMAEGSWLRLQLRPAFTITQGFGV